MSADNDPCLEIIACTVKPERLDDFLAIEKAQIAAMQGPVGQLERFMIKALLLQNAYLVCTHWESRQRPLEYCGERFQRNRFQGFVTEYLDGLTVSFAVESSIAATTGVPDAIMQEFGQR